MFDEGVQHGLQIREAHGLAHDDAFDLMEHRRVRHIRVVAVHPTRRDHRNGGLCARMVRIWTGEVCVRSSLPSGK